MIVANAAHADEIEAQLDAAGIAAGALILEPAARNTAPAIALAAFAAEPDAILLVMPSDHVIADLDAFHAAIERAVPLVEAGWLVTFGIAPNAPEIGYGYIRRGEEIAPGVQRVERFVEKPDRVTAEAYLTRECTAGTAASSCSPRRATSPRSRRTRPTIAAAAREAIDEATSDGARMHPDALSFGRSPDVSIDYAVMEKADRVAVVPVDMGWSDVGSWDALHELAIKDLDGNAHHGEVVAIDTTDCLIRSEGPLVAAVGVKDLIIIATRDAVLVLPRGDSQQIKRAIEALKRDGHVTLDKPWA